MGFGMQHKILLRRPEDEGLTPLRIAAIYALVAMAWTLFADHLLSLWVRDAATLNILHHGKTLVYILASAWMLHALIRRNMLAIRRSEEALRKSEARNQALLHAVPDLMLRIDRQGTYLDFKGAKGVSRAFPAGGFLGKRVADVLPADIAREMMARLERAFTGGEVQVFEYEMAVDGVARSYEARLVVSWSDEVLAIVRDITERKQAEDEKERLIEELRDALAKVKTLSGLLPICASCKSIRDDKGYWQRIEAYIRDHSDAEFSHGICPDCARKLYPYLYSGEK
jgi:PAS domain S-box-containing protein